MTVEPRRGTSRFVTEESGIRTLHSFSFGPHYDPTNTGFGPLTCHDHHLLTPHHGFERHRHADVEIVTWVVAGGLAHEGGDGVDTVVPGQAAVQRAGSGVHHREVADERGCRFVQAWLRPDVPGGVPRREVATVAAVPGELIPVVGPGAPLAVGVAGARLDVARLRPDDAVTLAAAPLAHLYVVSGVAAVAGDTVGEGDALRLTDEPAVTVTALATTELLVWRFDRA